MSHFSIQGLRIPTSNLCLFGVKSHYSSSIFRIFNNSIQYSKNDEQKLQNNYYSTFCTQDQHNLVFTSLRYKGSLWKCVTVIFIVKYWWKNTIQISTQYMKRTNDSSKSDASQDEGGHEKLENLGLWIQFLPTIPNWTSPVEWCCFIPIAHIYNLLTG